MNSLVKIAKDSITIGFDPPSLNGLPLEEYEYVASAVSPSRRLLLESLSPVSPLTPESTSVTFSGLRPLTDYQFRIRGKNPLGWGQWSPTVVYRTSEVPSAPNSVSVGSVSWHGYVLHYLDVV